MTWLAAWAPFSGHESPLDPYVFQAEIAAASNRMVAIALDDGASFQAKPNLVRLGQSDHPTLTGLFILPPGRVRGFQFEFAGASEITLGNGYFRSREGKVLAKFDFRKMSELQNLNVTAKDSFVQIRPVNPSQLSSFRLILDDPVSVTDGNEPSWTVIACEFLLFSGLYLMLRWTLSQPKHDDLRRRISRWVSRGSALARAHPVSAICFISIITVVLNCYPIIFFGRTFLSPKIGQGMHYYEQFIESDIGQRMLYDEALTLPEEPKEPSDESKGVDVGALIHAHAPYTILEREAIFNHHELPLWDRNYACGVSLLGQGQSMLGDPLHWLTIALGGNWRAWDIKFLLAKTLFAICTGLCAWIAIQELSIALLISFSSIWIGFFPYRYNHPAIFSVCYAPLILLCWLLLWKAKTWRSAGFAVMCLCTADIMEFSSGTAKEATMLLLFMNVAGFCIVLFSARSWKERSILLSSGAWASVLFLLVGAPLWVLFADELARSASVYENVEPLQLPLALMATLFDGMLGQGFVPGEYESYPSSNFLMLAGVLWFVSSGEVLKNRIGRAVLCAGLVPFALVFKIIPPSLVAVVPLLKNIGHIFNTFGCVLISLLPLLAAIGFKSCLETDDRTLWRRRWLTSCLLLTGLLVTLVLKCTVFRSSSSGQPEHLPTFFFVSYVAAITVAAACLPWALRWLRVSGGTSVDGFICLAVVAIVLHFRTGLYLETKFDHYVMNPRLGADLMATSPSIEELKQKTVEPARVCGFDHTLNPGYHGYIGLEGIAGSDALFNRYYRELYTKAGLWIDDGFWQVLVLEQTFSKFMPLYDLLNVRYYLRMPSAADSIPPGLSSLGTRDLQLLESKEAWPRAFFTDRIVPYRSAENFIQLVLKGDGRPFAAIQAENETLPPLPLPGSTSIPAHSYALGPNETAFTIDAPTAGIAVLSEAFETDNFRLTVNGAPTPYFRVNHAFKGVRIDRPGVYRIVFRYWPKVLTPALWLCGLGLGLLGATLWISLKNRHLLSAGSQHC